MSVKKKLLNYAKLMRLHKPIGIFLLLWPCLMALWIASNGKPDFFILFIFVAGVFVTRSAGCVINDIFDKDFDCYVERTQFRPLATKQVRVKEAIYLTILLLIFALLLVFNLNIQTIICSMGALITLLIYPLMKRIIALPQVVLGVAFAWSIPMAYFALEQKIDMNTLCLYMATLLWVFAYDTQYAMADSKDDQKIGIKSSALFFGPYVAFIIFSFQASSLLLFLFLGLNLKLGMLYFIGLFISTMLMFYQQYLIKDKKPEKCFQAFLNNNYFGASLFLGLMLNYALS